jgi:NTP pyrophosphatase (non-canonical NTP hydrolase)
MPNRRQYSMRDARTVAVQAARDIERYLWQLPHTLELRNVESDPYFQERDIDLVWRAKDQQDRPREVTIEIKGDRWHETGNFFFETVSNKARNTPGCFVYTRADYVFYYFVETHQLYVLPMPETREWFLAHQEIYRQVETTTAQSGGQTGYVTVGRLVPVTDVQSADLRVKTIVVPMPDEPVAEIADPTVGGPLELQLQETVRVFVNEHSLKTNIETRLLDLVSEVGELAKEALRMSDYGLAAFSPSPNWAQELGDVFCFLICLANRTDVNLAEALGSVLTKYRRRLETGASPDSGNKPI